MRRAARADQHAAHEQLHEVLREPAERGDAADESDAPGEHVLARVQVHQARQGDPDQHVEDNVGGPQEEAKLLVRQVKIALDVLGHHAEDLRVQKIQRRSENDHGEAVIGHTAGRPPLRLRSGLRPLTDRPGYLRDHWLPLVRTALGKRRTVCVGYNMTCGGLSSALWAAHRRRRQRGKRAMQNLPGKTAFVTGGASGIGLGIAKALLGAGMNVVIADIREDHLTAATAELGAAERVLALKLDVTDRAAYARAADAAEARFRKIHVLCNNAGVGVVGPTELATFADWDWVLGVNLGGTVNGIVILLPRIMRHGEGGHIVNTASMSGLVPHPGATLYGTSKGAVVAMIECMRGELEPHGIMCSAFSPGAVQSNIAKAGKTRPASLADTGYTETDKRRQQAGNFFHLFRTKEEVGQRVLRGILNDELYIMTHSEFRQGVEDRAQAMCAAVPDLPENEEYKRTFSFLFVNPIHAAETARQRSRKYKT